MICWRLMFPFQVLVVGQNVIIFDPSPAISVFQIPQFSPVIEEVSVVTEISKPLLIVPVKEHSHVTTTRRPNRLPHADARAYVDIIGEYGWDVTVHRFVVTPIQGTSWANAPTCLPIFLDASTFDYLEFSYDVLAKPLSADQTLLLWDNLGRLYAGTSSITPRWQNGRPLHPSISLWAYDCNDESDSACFDFCEFLGRLCVITKDHEVLVMDFIACPPSL
ncbi:hypothetical protein JAAARDRAFT_491783 [Jaapia argillacea MUCL 33604]|uniref:Uncharacterized protein n=1 Tax=Jaapia argillacea MUCL 33604 TaxID=933084 RepID=A0A067PBP2_9AGAM|nr:hypothetical protein JAAARDRAFT_491783 [Jaapia argillacea MUCL 33604]